MNSYHPKLSFMIRNYLKTALRNLARNKFNGFVNILGLAIGLAGCVLIGLFVLDEWRYDRFVPEGDRIYRVYDEQTGDQGETGYLAIVPPAMGPTLTRDFPEVEVSLRMLDTYDKQLFALEGQRYLEEKGAYVEPAFFDFFGIDLLEGDPAVALKEPNQVILSQSLARKYFGDQAAAGKTLSIEGREATVSGVMPDLPEHFHLDLHYLISFETINRLVPEERMQSWVWQQFFTYLKLREHADPDALAAKLPAFAERYAWPETEPRGFKYVPHLQPLADIHLYSASFLWDMARRGNITHVWGLSLIGLFLLVIAIINFINLSTARAERRAREVGIRKVSGAGRGQLITQFVGEAVLQASLAMLVAVQATRLLIPYLNDFSGKHLVFHPGQWPWLGVLAGIGLLVGFLAGSYPAFVLSAFRPVQVLKGHQGGEGRRDQWLRKSLVVVQFTLTVLLIIGTLVIYRQVSYLHDKDLGFRRDFVLTFPLQGDMGNNYELVKERFLNNPGVVSASLAYGIPGDIVAGDEIRKPGEATSYPANLFTVDYDYIRTMGMEIIAGRDFSRAFATDPDEAFLLNETAVKELGFSTPEAAIGQRLDWELWGAEDSLKQGRVIGVVRDFHYKGLQEKVGTVVLHIFPDAFWKVILRLDSDNLPQTIDGLVQTWETFHTGYPFEYQFVDDSFDAMYKSEEKLSTLLIIFTALTIIVACMGLLGLVIYAAEQRTREIGIRKVLGASVDNIVSLLARDFLRLVLIAFLIAAPIGWFVLKSWLEGFSYRITLSVWIFLLAGGAALLIALLTVSFHSVRAALANPVESLRNE